MAGAADELTLFLCGDVMTGRGIDQILPHSCTPELHEPHVRDARQYVELAEAVNGPIAAPMPPSYIWGDALTELQRVQPDLRMINLETSITTSAAPWPDKAVLYRMHPGNISCLHAAEVDVCSLANNHVLDWDYGGLEQTLDVLSGADIAQAGAGRTADEAQRPVVKQVGDNRIVFLACTLASSGTPATWAARDNLPGVFWLRDLSDASFQKLTSALAPYTRDNDIIICSIHWGPNWGHAIEPERRHFAHRLVDELGVDVVHGHSSHHPQCAEVYHGKVILYGCGDFINDYEGIRGYEGFRGDLTLMYFLTFSRRDKTLLRVEMTLMQLRQFRLHYARPEDRLWLGTLLNKSAQNLGTRYSVAGKHGLELNW